MHGHMDVKLAETCRWLLCNKVTFIHSTAFVGVFKERNTRLTHLTWNTQHNLQR
jgi:hypothetical protein